MLSDTPPAIAVGAAIINTLNPAAHQALLDYLDNNEQNLGR